MILFSLKYISSPSSILSYWAGPWGLHRCCSKFTWLYLQSPCSLLHNDPALGGYIYGVFSFLLVTGMNNMDFFLSGSIYIETSLKPSLCSTQDLGATCIILLWKNYFQILCFEQTELTQCHQSLRPCVCNPASSIIMNRRWQQSWTGVGNNHDPELSVFITRQWW